MSRRKGSKLGAKPVPPRRTTRNSGGLAPVFAASPRTGGKPSDRARRNAARQREVKQNLAASLSTASTDGEYKDAILSTLSPSERVSHDKQLAEQTVDTKISSGRSRVMVRPLLAVPWDTKAHSLPQCFHTQAVFSPAKIDRVEQRHDWDDFRDEAVHSVFFRHVTIKMLAFVEHYFRTLSKAATQVHRVQKKMKESTTLNARDPKVTQLTKDLVQAKGTFAHYVAVGRKKIPNALFCSVPGQFTKGDAVDGNYDHYPVSGRYAHPVALGDSVDEYPMDNIDKFCDAINEKKLILCDDFGGDQELYCNVPEDWEVCLWRRQLPTAGDKRTHTNEDKKTDALDAARDAYAIDLVNWHEKPVYTHAHSITAVLTAVIYIITAVISAVNIILLH
jgi:hypothetical protein